MNKIMAGTDIQYMKRGFAMDYVKAFLIGGLICALVQILMEKTRCFQEESWFCLYVWAWRWEL